MRATNPYESTATDCSVEQTPVKRSFIKRFLIGGAIGAAPPGLVGALGMYQFSVYAASLPPGQFVCGNGTLGPVLLVVFIAPLTGLVGAAIALALP